MCIRICSGCDAILEQRECKCSQVSYGLCDVCFDAALQEVDKWAKEQGGSPEEEDDE